MELKTFDSNLAQVRTFAIQNQGIAIHAVLEHIFTEAVKAAPRMIVELGVSKEALANKVLAMVAEMNDAEFWSCDLYDFSRVCSYPKWRFHRGDDIEFVAQFRKEYPLGPFSIRSEIDLLFIDTDELYGHVCEEIRNYFPLLSANATVMFRCTNLQKKLAYKDGTWTMKGWNNERGVIRAINDCLGIRFDETRYFEGVRNLFHVKHWPWGAGLTVLRKT